MKEIKGVIEDRFVSAGQKVSLGDDFKGPVKVTKKYTKT